MTIRAWTTFDILSFTTNTHITDGESEAQRKDMPSLSEVTAN